MHVKTFLQLLNAIESVETTDIEGKSIKKHVQDRALNFRSLFPDLKIIYKSGKWVSEKSQKENIKY